MKSWLETMRRDAERINAEVRAKAEAMREELKKAEAESAPTPAVPATAPTAGREPGTCAICGKPLPFRRSQCCSARCAKLGVSRVARSRKVAKIRGTYGSRRCKACGAEFGLTRRNQLYCPECRKECTYLRKSAKWCVHYLGRAKDHGTVVCLCDLSPEQMVNFEECNVNCPCAERAAKGE